MVNLYDNRKCFDDVHVMHGTDSIIQHIATCDGKRQVRDGVLVEVGEYGIVLMMGCNMGKVMKIITL